tara:strand:- start:49 stop:303 length:255 start_codon:yes stop_codon:yes gene_type:complete
MKEKNLPDDNISNNIEELTKEANNIVELLESKKDLKNSLEEYQRLIKLNNIIEKQFQKKSKTISQNIKEKINKVVKKNDKKRFK